MHMGRSRLLAGVFAVLAILTLAAAVPMFSDESSADISGTSIEAVYDKDKVIYVTADSGTDFTLYVKSHYANERILSVTASSANDHVNVNTSSIPVKIAAGEYTKVDLTLEAGRYAHQGDSTITLTFTIMDGDDMSTKDTGSVDLAIHVLSNLTSDKYNKFIGYFPNELDGTLGEVWFTALVSFFAMLAIGYGVMFIAVPVCSRIVMKKDDPDRQTLKKLLYKLCQVIVWLWVIGQVFRILGLSESVIDLINRLFYLAYVVVGIIVGWKLYKLIVDSVIKRIVVRAEDYGMEDKAEDFESFRPLFLYIGEIILAIVGTMLIMGLLGFNLAAIITSAGLVSLGISMGAQDVLKQFFSGLEILATRPFRKGDLVTVGTDASIFRVRRVNVMNTFLENWDNTDVTIMPNSLLTTNKIKNITRDTLISKVYITVDIAYGSDVNLARRLMQEAAVENPHVISDGSVTRPYTRLEAFEDSNLLIKMGFYVDDFGSQWSISGQIRQSIITKFAANGIQIDYQQIVIHEGKPSTRPEGKDAAEDEN